MSDQPPFERIGIAGLGLIGGSIAMRAIKLWPSVRIVGLDRSETVEEAVRLGIVHEVVATATDLADADLIVLAVPLEPMIACITALGETGTKAVVTDVGSTKRRIMAAAVDAKLSRFVGGHPMAGTEHSGLRHAQADMFEARPWLLLEEAIDPDVRRLLGQFVSGLGATVRWIRDVDAHDRTMAYVSHLPHLVSTALMNVAIEAVGDAGVAIAGPSLAGMTRLVSSSPDMWERIVAENADFIAEALAQFVATLPTTANLSDDQWVRQAFVRAGAARARWRGEPPAGV